ncbi:esterase/lipase family protein [Streptomyces sp. NPDC049813]|uniref:esterase/lipase family protein n=1 Tax=Streptomyces sp. NPDC049813 TaxID=3365597 RepID=UPI0037A3F00C
MQVARTVPVRPHEQPSPVSAAGLSMALLKSTVLELAVLAGHLLLYPSGVLPERRRPGVLPEAAAPAPPQKPPAPHPPAEARTPVLTPTPAPRTGRTAAATRTRTPRIPTPRKPPVLLLHGFIDNRSVFVLLRRSLAQQGRQQIESLNYSPLTCDIRTAATLLGRHVEELCERTGQERIDIVGHSLGGLIARYYVQCLGGDRRVRTLVTLGTPHAGTRVAPLANAHPIVRQMRPGSAVVEELTRPAPSCRTRFVSFWSDLDQLMVPLETACVDHPDLCAQNVRVTGIGHLALPVHPAVATGVRQALDAEPADAGAPAAGSAGGLTVA